MFVVAVAQVSNELHLGLAAGDIGRSVFQYVFVFGAIWWAWMAFTWFASAYDTDDVAYRLTVFVQPDRGPGAGGRRSSSLRER